MSESYLTVAEPVRAEITIKKSRFIASLSPIGDEMAARDFIAAIKKEFYDARHNPSAWLLEIDLSRQKSSDDGEPGGTAGQPILSVLAKNHLTFAACVVTRYFGGIKLGAAGLIRAYGEAASLAVQKATLLRVGEYFRQKITLDYSLYQSFENYCRANDISLKNVDYAAKVTATCLIAPEKTAIFSRDVTDMTNGQAKILADGQDFVKIVERESCFSD